MITCVWDMNRKDRSMWLARRIFVDKLTTILPEEYYKEIGEWVNSEKQYPLVPKHCNVINERLESIATLFGFKVEKPSWIKSGDLLLNIAWGTPTVSCYDYNIVARGPAIVFKVLILN